MCRLRIRCVCVRLRPANKVWKVHRNAINNERVSETIAEFIYDTFLLFCPHWASHPFPPALATFARSVSHSRLDCGRSDENAHNVLCLLFNQERQTEARTHKNRSNRELHEASKIHKYQLRKCVAAHNSLKLLPDRGWSDMNDLEVAVYIRVLRTTTKRKINMKNIE